MAKSTPINQEFILDIKAKSTNIESSIKSMLDKLQNSNLSNAFTKPYINSLQRILDKNLELKKVILSTDEVNSKTASNWISAYGKIAAELTRTMAKLESSEISFKDILGYDENLFKKLQEDLKKIQQAKKDLYGNKKLISDKIDPAKVIDKDLVKTVASNISSERTVNALIDSQIMKAQDLKNIHEKDLKQVEEQIRVQEKLRDIIQTIAEGRRIANSTRVESAALGFDFGNAGKQDALAFLRSKQTEQINLNGDISDLEDKKRAIKKSITSTELDVNDLQAFKTQAITVAQELGAEFQQLENSVLGINHSIENLKMGLVSAAQSELDPIIEDANTLENGLNEIKVPLEQIEASAVSLETQQNFFTNMQGRVTQLFGLGSALQLIRRFAQEAWSAIKELDAAFTEIAVVTEYSTTELWKSFDDYNTMAQRLGVTTVDAIETSALYYQQGLETAEVMLLTTETVKMARIANMDYAEATQAMTAAVRGFKMEMGEAGRVTDVYSALAAEAAVDTEQLATAISKTASIAGNAGMSFENTSAFLTQIIETTQEAPETAGTALKTIIARFSELTKDPAILSVEVDGEEVNANNIEKALKTANVQLRDSTGEFRDLDEVFMELASRWDSLARSTQRYIATTAAGSRQQSRFIAMMSDYKRATELAEIANNSAGASQIQFAKTLDSVNTKVNKLSSNFQKLIGNLVENQAVRDFLDLLNDALSSLVEVSDKGILAFASAMVAVGFITKNALSLVILGLSNLVKNWEAFKQEVRSGVEAQINFRINRTEYDRFKAEVNNTPLTSSTGVPAASGAPVGAAIDSFGKSMGVAAAKGIGAGILTGIVTGKWQIALYSGIVQTIVSALSNKVILETIQKTFRANVLPQLNMLLANPATMWIAVGVAATAALVALAKWIDPLSQAERKVTKIKQQISDLQDELEKTEATFLAEGAKLKSLTSSIEEYKKLSAQIVLTADEQEDLNNLSTELATNFPELVSGYNEAGVAILNQRANWEEIVKLQKEATDLAKKDYATNILKTSLLEADLVNAQYDEAKQRIERLGSYEVKENSAAISQIFAGNIGWNGKETDKLKQARDLIANMDGHFASLALSAQKLQNAFKQIASADFTALEGLNDTNLTTQTELFGQQFVSNRQLELKEFLDSIKDVAPMEKLQNLDSYKALSKESKDFLTSIGSTAEETVNKLQDLGSDEIVEFMTKASNHISAGVFDSLINLDKQYKDKLAELLSRGNNLTVSQFKKQLTGILGEDSTLLDTIVEYYSNSINSANTYLANAFGEGTVNTLLDTLKSKGKKLSDLLTEYTKSSGNAIQYLVELGIDETQAEEFIADLRKFLRSEQYQVVVDVIGLDNYTKMVGAYGQRNASNAVDFIDDKSKAPTEEVQKAFAGADVSTVIGAQQLLATLVNDAGLEYEDAKEKVLRFAAAVGQSDKVNQDSIKTFKTLDGALSKTKFIDKYAKTIRNLNGDYLDLTDEGINELIESVPGAGRILTQFNNGLIDGAQASKDLKAAIEEADFKQVQTAVGETSDAISEYGISSVEAKEALNSLKISENDWLSNQAEVQAILNGNTEAFWNLVDAKLAFIGLTDTMDDVTFNNLQAELEKTIGATASEVHVLTDEMMAYATILESLGMVEIVEDYITLAPDSNSDPVFSKEKVRYMRKKAPATKTNYTRYTPKGSSGSSYKTKTTKYDNEIRAIAKITNKLTDLNEARENSGISFEEYNLNTKKTIGYTNELQSALHSYNEKLRAGREELIQKINSSGYGEAVKVVNGELITNHELISQLLPETQEAIDDIIASFEDYNSTILENSNTWAQLEEDKRRILEESLEAHISLEEKIRSILIERDKKEIEDTQKKYTALTDADNKYLESLKKNIDKRRVARDMEQSYSDIAKKEKRLALLKRDTSGIYAAEALALEEELVKDRQAISDKEVDNMIASLEEEAKTKADAREKEIKLAEDNQDAKEKSLTYYNSQILEIMNGGLKNLLTFFQTYDNEYLKGTATAQQKYIEDWKATIKTASDLIPISSDLGVMTPNQERAKATADSMRAFLRDPVANESGISYEKGASDISSHNAKGAYDWYVDYIKGRTDLSQKIKDLFWNIVIAKYNYDGKNPPEFPGYSSGGLVNYTGMAMVHGSSSKPEAFLSAEDTRNFQTLSQLLSDVILYNGKTSVGQEAAVSTAGGDINITIEVAELANDYDVEQMVNKIKQEIVNSANYRNVNMINKVR